MRKRKIALTEFYKDEHLKLIYKEVKVDNLDDLYYDIGKGKHTANNIINIVFKDEEEKPKLLKTITKTNIDNTSSIMVAGLDKVKVTFASCCKPVYGDQIVGYITKGNGISVHRSNCHNLTTLEDRCIEVKWTKADNLKYNSILIIRTNTLENRLADIIQRTSMLNINISSIKTISRDEYATYEMEILVKDKDSLAKLLLDLENLPYITSVERLMK